MGLTVSPPNITPWVAWTPTGSWSTNTTYTGFKRQVGKNYQYQVRITTAGAPTSANLTITLAETIDTAFLVTTAALEMPLGIGIVIDSTTTYYDANVYYASSTSVSVYIKSASGANVTMATVSQISPFTFGAGDAITITFSVPIVGA